MTDQPVTFDTMIGLALRADRKVIDKVVGGLKILR